MEKRIFLAVVISIALLVGWSVLIPKFFPELVRKPAPAKSATTSTTTPSSTTSTTASATTTAATTSAAPSSPASMSAATAADATPVVAARRQNVVVDTAE
ncbi:MAG TPA: hypothetical protein VF608_03585, partial [Thermoanaerobaculia bacterium]